MGVAEKREKLGPYKPRLALSCRQWGATEQFLVRIQPEHMGNLGRAWKVDWRLQKSLKAEAVRASSDGALTMC